jgi:fibro-slime domain-containing protein
MLQTTRFYALGSLLLSALLVGACGGVPDDPSGADTLNGAGTGGQSTSTGNAGSSFQLNAGGNGAGGSGTVIGEGGEAGSSGPVCGDGIIESPETCDDGNAKPGDGCDGNCQTEANWKCPTPGKPCVSAPTTAVCGNGKLESGETCDLGSDANGVNKNDGTLGCDANCQTVAGWTCPATGAACTKNAYCGDGVVQTTLGEQCDDGSNDGTHGCSSTCQVIIGWKCPATGGACAVDQYCGNGVVDPGEQCDDHNLRSYDGCSSTCFIEAGWSCPATGGSCTRICGNGKLDAGETCDDSNFYSGDGCSSTCQLEPNYTCAVVGQACVYTPPPPPSQCGNGIIEGTEACDDGNTQSGDGCSSTCTLESGWKCAAADTPCTAAKCGDGILAGAEQCDDGIVDNAHGCSSTCTIEPNAVCPAAGGACIPMVCGDGKVTGTEQCDNGVNDGKHGCSTTCQLIPGWVCPLAGTQCSPICGDGLVVGSEQCDEKGDAPCCTSACTLKPGYVCDPSKTPHSQLAAPYCGDGTVEGPSNPNSTVKGAEQCDDGNTAPFDGCSPTCTNEPLCGTLNTYLANPTPTTYQCFAHCGDGLVLPPEQCDDGNTQDGDGCDHNCNIELVPGTTNPAWTCVQPPPGSTLTLPVVWRDFSPRLHPQFSIEPRVNRRLPQIPKAALQAVNIGGVRIYKYVPAYNTAFVSPTFGGSYTNMPDWTMNGPGWVSGSEGYKAPPWMNNPPAYDVVWWADQPATLSDTSTTLLSTPAGRFAQWYVDDATVNKTYNSTLTLKGVNGSFQYSCDDTACDTTTFSGNPSGFFPLDGKGWVAAGKETARDGGHNYSFTTEMRYWFAFQGGEQLAFYGDDDLWVFVNGQLTLDIGGIHSKTAGNFSLGTNGNATACVENIPGDGGNTTNCSTVNLGLTKNSVYEIAIFNAEREVVSSNFQLTLEGFNASASVCTPICGDGYVAGSEQCDRGALNVSPTGNTYGQCTTQCKLGPYCGDDILQTPPEVCDNGLNIDSYVNTSPAALMCAPGCVAPAYCGDGVIQKVDGEECDDTTAKNQNSYGHCQTNCKLGARCGDGVLQAGNGEQCDDGANNGSASSSCDGSCKLKCGNHTVDAGEQCDDGTGPSGNGTTASQCDTSCQFKCGNGQLDPGEQCDDGKNNSVYGGCAAGCVFAPYCGDKVVQNPPEVCDNGSANSPTAYGVNSCTDQCVPGGTCGDGIVNGGEKCDDGKNTGLPGSCKTDCSAYVPSTQCGDGVTQPPEQCDDGAANNTASSKCDANCRLKCGNALIDPGEQCDNGVNNGSYGTCKSNCTLASYCGDGVKDPSEQCDKGSANVAPATAYGVGVCTTACKDAPFCGDGHIQSQFGEQCEGNVDCISCQIQVVK